MGKGRYSERSLCEEEERRSVLVGGDPTVEFTFLFAIVQNEKEADRDTPCKICTGLPFDTVFRRNCISRTRVLRSLYVFGRNNKRDGNYDERPPRRILMHRSRVASKLHYRNRGEWDSFGRATRSDVENRASRRYSARIYTIRSRPVTVGGRGTFRARDKTSFHLDVSSGGSLMRFVSVCGLMQRDRYSWLLE